MRELEVLQKPEFNPIIEISPIFRATAAVGSLDWLLCFGSLGGGCRLVLFHGLPEAGFFLVPLGLPDLLNLPILLISVTNSSNEAYCDSDLTLSAGKVKE